MENCRNDVKNRQEFDEIGMSAYPERLTIPNAVIKQSSDHCRLLLNSTAALTKGAEQLLWRDSRHEIAPIEARCRCRLVALAFTIIFVGQVPNNDNEEYQDQGYGERDQDNETKSEMFALIGKCILLLREHLR